MNKKFEVFSFEVVSGMIIVSDPCYDFERGECNFIDNVVNGFWEVLVEYDNDRPKKINTKALKHISNNDFKRSITRDICMDSGMVGFYDLKFFQNSDIIDDLNKFYKDGVDQWLPEQKWFSANFGATQNELKAGNVPHGFVVSTPYMVGCCDLYCEKQNDEIIGFEIVLLE